MPIEEIYSGSANLGGELSLTTNTAGPDVDTTAGVYQIFLELELTNIAELDIRIYEKARSGDTQRVTHAWSIGVVDNNYPIATWVSPFITLMHGWDATADSSNNTIAWSIRRAY
jgi:hypothetical protein